MAITPETPVEDIPTPEALKPLFEPVTLGAFQLANRAAYAPLTRCRAINTVPVDFSADYYAARSSKGRLVITEATLVSANGHGYPNTPGIYTDEQMAAWKPIVEAVKATGATFLCQLWHCGRTSHSAYNADGSLPVAPSAVAIGGDTKVFHPSTFEVLDFETPRALEASELPGYVAAFRQGAANAMACGFDGVELHAGNGYLLDEFLKDSCNKRTDAYGGSLENRCRFVLECLDALVEEVGADKVGVRLTPYGNFGDAFDSDPNALFKFAVTEIAKRGVAYVHMIEPRVNGNEDREASKTESLEPFRAAAKSAGVKFIAAGGYVAESAAAAIANDHADVVAIGRYALANPDLLKRFKLGAPLNKYDRDTFYVPGEKGYTDYPLLQDTPDGARFFD